LFAFEGPSAMTTPLEMEVDCTRLVSANQKRRTFKDLGT
jgi:hypothetical protein